MIGSKIISPININYKPPILNKPIQKKQNIFKEIAEQTLITLGIELGAFALEVVSEGALIPYLGPLQAERVSSLFGDLTSTLGNATYYYQKTGSAIVVLPFLPRSIGSFNTFLKQGRLISKFNEVFENLSPKEQSFLFRQLFGDLKKIQIENILKSNNIDQLNNFLDENDKFNFDKILRKYNIKDINQKLKQFQESLESKTKIRTNSKLARILSSKKIISKFRFNQKNREFSLSVKTLRLLNFLSPTYATRIGLEKGFEEFKLWFERTKASEQIEKTKEIFIERSKKLFGIGIKDEEVNVDKIAFNKLNSKRLYQAFLNDGMIPNEKKDSWIWGYKIMKLGIDKRFISVFIYKKPSRVKNYEPVVLDRVLLTDLENFVRTWSKGSYYLRNWAWGWDIGKFLTLSDNILINFSSNGLGQLIRESLKIRSLYKRYELVSRDHWKGFKDQFNDDYGSRKNVFGESIKTAFREVNYKGLVTPAIRTFLYKSPKTYISFGTHRFKRKIVKKRYNYNSKSIFKY